MYLNKIFKSYYLEIIIILIIFSLDRASKQLVIYYQNININSEIYLDSTKNLKKQLTYADKKGCSLAIICGQEEIEQNKITIKKLKSKKENDQVSISSNNLVNEIKKLI